MKTLRQEGLFGEGLVSINTPLLVNRYNACLEDIGIEPTRLRFFSIDGIGWSPEVAAEKRDNFYLSHGGANQFAIILTPKQYKKPVYFPFYSFTRNLMKKIFDEYMRQIVDITGQTAIWLDIDQELSHYLNPLDLLMVDSIVVHVFTVNDIIQAAEKQRELTRRFMSTDDWFDSELRGQIIESAKAHGDLRFRSVVIPDIPFNDTRCFYTMAFDGIYLFRDVLQHEKSMLILENEELIKEFGEDMGGIFSVSASVLPTRLIFEGLARFDMRYYHKNPDALDIKRECMFVDILSEHYPELRYDKLNMGQKKKFVRQLKHYLPKEFFELERLARQIRSGQVPRENLSYKMIKILMYPNPDLPLSVQDVLWQLITETEPLDIVSLYTYNKSRFFSLYEEWPRTKRNWAVELLRCHYVPRMSE
ncbi:Uncharacterized protein dnm_049910 [Desulfonema magnum]|uniref:Uncharacterized protein n=2 Tax=Desulfonema magnum TaxID=45655 RepID=A0A975BPS4_9BACT|nr:Uncharacterized protein dnm_049910 [Desulfonema magnum]